MRRSGAAIRLGEDTTDTEGRYTIRYDTLPGVTGIHLRVSVSGEDGTLLQSSELIRDARPLEIVNLTVPLTEKPAAQRRIEGRIVLEHGLPAEKIKLRLYRRDFGGAETLLGETTTREDGLYALPYDVGGKAASLEVRAVDAAGEEIPLSKTMHDLSERESALVNLVAPTALQPLAAEYQRLTADLTPHVGEMTKLADARENAERQDLTVLNRATGWDARLIALASNAAKLSADAGRGALAGGALRPVPRRAAVRQAAAGAGRAGGRGPGAQEGARGRHRRPERPAGGGVQDDSSTPSPARRVWPCRRRGRARPMASCSRPPA